MKQIFGKLSEKHRRNPYEGGITLDHIGEYSYHDTLLYELVFHKGVPCSDYISHTVFYDSRCLPRAEMRDGGLKYRHEVIPAWVDPREIAFVRNRAPEDLETVKLQKMSSPEGRLLMNEKESALNRFL